MRNNHVRNDYITKIIPQNECDYSFSKNAHIEMQLIQASITRKQQPTFSQNMGKYTAGIRKAIAFQNRIPVLTKTSVEADGH